MKMTPEIIIQVRNNVPLIHHITNVVVNNFTANGVLAFGAAPIMAKAVEEVEEIASISNALLLNIGTITSNEVEAMILAGKQANKKGIPVVIDPVGVAASRYRSEVMDSLLKNIKPTVIKGNIGELAHLVGILLQTKGVEAVEKGDSQEVARQVARAYQTIAVVTGEKDVISDGEQVKINESGHPFLEKVTGAGCLLGSIIAACLTTNHSKLEASATAVAFYGYAAQYAAKTTEVNGPGTFMPAFLDALSFDLDIVKESTL